MTQDQIKEANRTLYNRGEIFTNYEVVEILKKLQDEVLDKYPSNQCTGELTGYADAIEDVNEAIKKCIDELLEARYHLNKYKEVNDGSKNS